MGLNNNALGAVLVCRVPITSTPVSAALSAREMVSTSRSSPTTNTSGLSLREERNADEKASVCLPT